MLRINAAFNVHHLWDAKRHLPRLSYQDTHTMFIAWFHLVGRKFQLVSAMLVGKCYNRSTWLKRSFIVRREPVTPYPKQT